jgi:hypothetical protein
MQDVIHGGLSLGQILRRRQEYVVAASLEQPTMTDTPRLVSAQVYLAWWEAVSERLAQNPSDKGTSILLWQLDAIGRSSDATRLVAMRHETGAGSLRYMLASYPDERFDWEHGAVDFARTAFLTVDPDLLIHDLVKITGIPERG